MDMQIRKCSKSELGDRRKWSGVLARPSLLVRFVAHSRAEILAQLCGTDDNRKRNGCQNYKTTSAPSILETRTYTDMRPTLLQGHERSLNQIKYNRDGDLLFSVAKDKILCAWYTSNGERLGTYSGHQGAIWTVDVSPNSKIIATGAADNTIKLWDIATGECLKTWEFQTAIKRVEFSEDGKQILGVTEKRMGHLGSIVVYDVRYGEDLRDQSNEFNLKITCEESKATVAAWSFLDKYIIAGHEDGSVSQYDSKVGTVSPKIKRCANSC